MHQSTVMFLEMSLSLHSKPHISIPKALLLKEQKVSPFNFS